MYLDKVPLIYVCPLMLILCVVEDPLSRCSRCPLKRLLLYQLVLRDMNLLRHLRLALRFDLFSRFWLLLQMCVN